MDLKTSRRLSIISKLLTPLGQDLKTKKKHCPCSNYKEVQFRKQIRKKQKNEGSATKPALNRRDKFCTSTCYVITDKREAHMKRRGELYKVLSQFSFLNDMDTSEEQGSQKLVDSHLVEFNMNLYGELQRFCYSMNAKLNETGKLKFNYIDLHHTIAEHGIQ